MGENLVYAGPHLASYALPLTGDFDAAGYVNTSFWVCPFIPPGLS